MKQRRGVRTRVLLLLAAALSAALLTGRTRAQECYNIQAADVYVKMDFWKAPDEQTAEAWHFDPNNNMQWTQLPNDPASARPRARFKVEDLYLHELMLDDEVWFIGVDNIQVVTGAPGNFTIVSGVAEYVEMLDRIVFAVQDPQSAGIQIIYDPCGTRVWPIAAGSDLTPYRLHPHTSNPGGYGIRMKKEALLASTGWRWKNPAGVAPADVYVVLTILHDMVKKPNPPCLRHVNVGVSWISAGDGCAYDFCLSAGQPTVLKVGSPVNALDGWAALVAAVPHTLDHTAALQLYWRHGTEITLLIDSSIGDSVSQPVAHKCEPEGMEIPWHTHAPGVTGHLRPSLGLSFWQGRYDLNSPQGNEVFTAASFDVPAHSVAAPTNHRALYMVFWHGLGAPEP